MAVLLVAEVLALLTLVGIPITFALLPSVEFGAKRMDVAVRVLLAPVSGFCVFALYTSVFYAFRLPVGEGLPVLWGLVTVGWCGLLIWRWPTLRARLSGLSLRARSLPNHIPVAAGLTLVIAAYVWPFIHDQSLVFWHYAGSDGYMYMRIAEHVAWVGTDVIPLIGVYDGASGFLAEEMRHFHSGTFVDKPGTMSTLGGLSATLGVLPHEAFSPLVIAAMGMLYLSLVFFAATLGVPGWLSPVFAVFGTLAPSAWMMATHTFLGNALALPLFPIALALLTPNLSARTGAYAGLIVAGQIVVFPDGTLALIGMLAPYTLFLLMQAWKGGYLAGVVLGIGMGAGVCTLLLMPFGGPLIGTAFQRLGAVTSTGVRALADSNNSGADVGTSSLGRMQSVDWIWGALNLNTIPPSPIEGAEIKYLLALFVFSALYVARSIWRREARNLVFYVVAFYTLMALGVLTSLFRSDYELFRGLAVFAYVPLVTLFLVPMQLTNSLTRGATRIAGVVSAIAAVWVLVRFVQVDRAHFLLGYESHAADAQYTTANIRDRDEIARVATAHTVVLGTDTPTFTAFANVLMLVSPARPAVPDGMRKFVFFGPEERADGVQYLSDAVLLNRRYEDVWRSDATERDALYRSDDFVVVRNDLVPFFDNDTLPMLNGFPRAFLVDRQLSVARVLTGPTAVVFVSREERNVRLEVQFGPDHRPGRVQVWLDGQATGTTYDNPSDVQVTFAVGGGLQRLWLDAGGQPARISSFKLIAE